MKQNIYLCALAVAAIAFSSCSTGRYVNNSLNLNQNQTQVVLSTNNFRVVKTVSAFVEYKGSTFKFNKEQLQQNAYAELIRKANLKGSQMLVNVTLENVQQEEWGLLLRKYHNGIMAQGVVIEFFDPSKPNATQTDDAVESATTNQDPTNLSELSIPAVADVNKGTNVAVSQATNIDIRDVALKTYLCRYYDNNKDGEISIQEAASVISMDCSERGILDMSAIVYFTNLNSLDASGNMFEEIDLTKCSKLQQVKLKSKYLEKVKVSEQQRNTLSIDVNSKKLEN